MFEPNYDFVKKENRKELEYCYILCGTEYAEYAI